MISFDISSFFTKVPIDESIKLIHDQPLEDDTLEHWTNISVQEFVN